MLKTYIDEKGDYILTNPMEELVKKNSSDDLFMNSESPGSIMGMVNMELGSMGSLGGLGLNVFEESDKDMMKEMSRYINSGFPEEQKKDGNSTFSL